MSSFHIRPVRSPEDLAAAISLFTAYAASLNLDLSFQGFEAEMAAMPGKYAPPRGELLLAHDNATGTALGCIGLRPLPGMGDDMVCEMKRLYVQPMGRGKGVAKALVMELLHVAEKLGYEEIRLDTLPHMVAATTLYKNLGFREVDRYYDTPVEGTIFLGRKIGTARTHGS